ncbi:MAG: Dipeptidyl aminopeptidase BIII [Calditrichaeota bacterium]|nr:Dipeptidyl aminopeptidase BIII [Calditrichota bacterium]
MTRLTRILLPALCALAIAGCTSTRSPELIPLEVLFGNPSQTQPRLSPDGSTLTYIAPLDGVLNIWVHEPGDGDDRPLTHDTGRGIRYHQWLYDGEHVIYLQDRDGDENWRIYMVNVAGGELKELTPEDPSVEHPVRAEPLAISREKPNQIIVGMNKRDARVHDVYRIDVTTGNVEMIEQGRPDNLLWVIDHELRVRGYQRSNPNGSQTLLLREPGATEFEEAIRWEPEDALTAHPIDFAGDNRTLYLISSRGRNAAAVYAYDTATGERTLLASDPMYDASKLLQDPETHEAQAALFIRERRNWTVFDESIRDDFTRIRENARGDFLVSARTVDDSQWLIYYDVDNGPGVYYRFDRAAGEFEKLFVTRPELADQPLVEMEPVTFTARDGMELHGYLTMPENAQPPVPLVLNVHGGPWTRDYWGYDPEAQWLANRGYACLQVNYRGSTGYGKQYLNAGDREWGGAMQTDLSDGVRWAIDEDIADPDRIAIYGASYGGYAALAGASMNPDVYDCAISVVGPSSLETLLSSLPPYWSSYIEVFETRVGRLPRYESGPKAGLPKAEADWTEQDRKDIEFLRGRSPLYHADKIRIPLLIGQGANDPRVKQAESDQIVEELRKRGIEVEYVVYPDEGHGFAKPENRIDFYRRAERFLARHLGGRVEG